MDDNVIRLNPDTIEDLKKRKLLREQQEAVELEPVGPGEIHIGYLEDSERTVFTEMASLHTELESKRKELTARTLEMFAAAVRGSETPQNINEHIDETIIFPSVEEAEEFYGLETRFQYLQALFNSSLRDRYGHRAVYGVRSNFSVVRVMYKHKLAHEIKHGTP